MRYQPFIDLLDRGRNLGMFYEQLVDRIILTDRLKEETRRGNLALLNDPRNSKYYHPVMPTLPRWPGNRPRPWWASPGPASPAPDGVDLHPPEGGSLE